jgi:hypothetical protein
MNLPDFEIKIGGIEYENSFRKDVRIDRTNLDEEFATQPEKYAYWGFIAEMSKARFYTLKFELDDLYARVEFEKRQTADAMKASNPKFKYTEKMCESEVITDARYAAKKLEMLEAQKLAAMVGRAAEAIAQRVTMLNQMGANVRVTEAPSRVMEQQHQVAKDVIVKNKKKSRRKPKKAA